MSDSSQSPDTAASLHERSDDLLARMLGRDLQSATLLGAAYLVVLGAILATIAVLVG
jgi:hypothetical protein